MYRLFTIDRRRKFFNYEKFSEDKKEDNKTNIEERAKKKDIYKIHWVQIEDLIYSCFGNILNYLLID